MTTIRALFIRNTLAALLPLLVLTLLILNDQERSGRESLDRSLLVADRMAGRLLGDLPPAQVQSELGKLGRRLAVSADSLDVRLTVIAEDGRVLADTDADPATMGNHAARPEVRQALQTGVGTAERSSSTLRETMRYVALLEPAGGARRIYRAAAPTRGFHAQTSRTRWSLFSTVIAVLVLGLLLSLRLGRQLVGPIEMLSVAARRFAAGEPNAHVIPDGPETIRRLGVTYNSMVDRLSEQVRRLDEAQGYLDAVIRQMPEGLLVIDARGSIARANEAAVALLGLPQDRILGRPVLGALLSYPVDRAVSQVLDGSAEYGDTGGTVEVRGPDGRLLRVTAGPLVVGGRPAGAVVLLQDVSELRRVDEMRKDFVANVSHELRTPLASIRALAETLGLHSEKRPALVGEYVPRIVDSCERIDRLVQDLLLLAQTEAGQVRVELEPLDPREIAEAVLRQVEPLAGADTRIVLDSFADAWVEADRFALSQCLRNLVDNALRYAPGGTIRVGSRREGGQVRLYVSDTGPGIPPDDQPRIFERFYRVEKHRSRDGDDGRGGSGLGLSIVRHLTELQGGRASVDSRVGEGSTFYLIFPVAD